MAAFRTRSCVLAVKLSLWLTILSYTTDCVGAQLPKVNPDDPSTIIWGELPPVPTATNMTSPGSRPSTLAAMAEGFVDLVQPKGLPLGEY